MNTLYNCHISVRHEGIVYSFFSSATGNTCIYSFNVLTFDICFQNNVIMDSRVSNFTFDQQKATDPSSYWRNSGAAEGAVERVAVYVYTYGKMADSEEPKPGPCTFLFKKSTKKFAGRKRRASDSDKGSKDSFNWRFCCFSWWESAVVSSTVLKCPTQISLLLPSLARICLFSHICL